MSEIRRSHKTVRRPYIRLLLIYLIVLLLGYAMTRDRTPGADTSGGFTMLVGAGGTIWELCRWLRWWWHRRWIREEARLRGELKTLRATRAAEQQERKRHQRQVQTDAALKQTLLQQETRREERAIAQKAERQRQARAKAVTAEAVRLQGLSDEQLYQELPDIFATQGLRLQSAALQDLCLMRLEDEGLEVARCVPQEHTVTVADVEALEQWRNQVGASHAYLIARNSFSVPALRLANHYPLTLVEPFVLAQWKTQGEAAPEPQVSSS